MYGDAITRDLEPTVEVPPTPPTTFINVTVLQSYHYRTRQ